MAGAHSALRAGVAAPCALPIEPRTEEAPAPRVVLVGNPNVGKSALFGALTGTYVTVSNYPGTTVEVARGWAHLGGRRTAVVDTPGAASLLPASEDERVTRDLLLELGAFDVLEKPLDLQIAFNKAERLAQRPA